MLGRSPRMYASKVLFKTVAQPRSLGSGPSEELSSLLSFGPRSGQFREGSASVHLEEEVLKGRIVVEKAIHQPGIMEVVREGSSEKPVEA